MINFYIVLCAQRFIYYFYDDKKHIIKFTILNILKCTIQ